MQVKNNTMINKTAKKRFIIATYLSPEERESLDAVFVEEKEKYKKAFPGIEPNKIVNDATFLRELIRKEIDRRKRVTRRVNKS